MEIYDDGGPFISNAKYGLGYDGTNGNLIRRPVAGLGALNTLTIRAASGESPVITGRGAVGVSGSGGKGGMMFLDIGNISIEGLDVTGGDFGLIWSNLYGNSNIRVAGCKIYGLLGTVAVGIAGSSPPEQVHNVVIENNMFWNCVGPSTSGGLVAWGVVCGFENGTNWVVRNNTVVHVSPAGTGWHVFHHRGEAWSEFSGNVVYLDHPGPMIVFNGNFRPAHADHNVFYVSGQATIGIGGADWSVWQSFGLDPNGLNTDPLLVSVTPGSEDLRLRPDSPAIDLIPFGGPALDVFGNPRPYGLGFDAGAHELQNFGARAGLPAASALAGPAGGPFSITLNHGDALADVAIQLFDPEADDITVSAITPYAALAGVAAPAIPAPSHPLTLAWTGFIDDTNPPGTCTWTVEFADAGTGFEMTCEVSITVTTPPPVALLTPNPLPAGRVGQPYSLALQATGTGTLVFSLLSGDLPSGLSLSATGHITGTPGAYGEYTFTVQAADNFTKEQQDYEISIKPKPPPDTDSGSCSVAMAQRGRSGSSPANRALALAALVFFIGTLALARRRR